MEMNGRRDWLQELGELRILTSEEINKRYKELRRIFFYNFDILLDNIFNNCLKSCKIKDFF